jgi:hypothetical protein
MHLQHDQLSQGFALKRSRRFSILSHIMDCQNDAPARAGNSPCGDRSIKVTLQKTECVAGPTPTLRNLNAGLYDLIKNWKQARLDVAPPFDNRSVEIEIHRKHPLFG